MSPCPSEGQLVAFAAGACGDDETRAMQLHVGACAICASWMAEAERAEELVEQLRCVVDEDRAAGGAGDAELAESVAPEVPGYRIVDRLGEGGMGVVYRAEQERPRRAVALKIVRQGFPSQRALRRFEHEAEILGRLSHPGIAQIFAAGTFDAGRERRQPFYAMELVSGVPLSSHVATAGLDVRARLRLFVLICDAVQHAHQHAILHRDLKPGNILVDTRGQPKVLDFGVARVLHDDGGGPALESLRTLPGQIVGTVPYMSPEQVQGDARDLDVRSDVYALGVILYELLAGRLPHDFEGHTVLEQVRIVCEREPLRLGRVAPALRGDLETIVHKALDKDRERRYASASDLAADVDRFLRDEPIAARPPSTGYLMRKFARRNRALVAGVVAVFGVLVGGIVTTWMQAQRADRHARQESERADQATAARDFLQEVLVLASPTEHGAHEPTIRAALDIALERVDRVEDPIVEAAVRHTLGRVLLAMNRLDDAKSHLDRALAAYDSSERRHDAQVVYVLADLCNVYRRLGDFAAAVVCGERALAMRGVLDARHDFILMVTVDAAGLAYLTLGRAADAERCFREAVDVAGGLERERAANLAVMNGHLAAALQEQGEVGEAERLYREVLAQNRERFGARDPNVAVTLGNYAGLLHDCGRDSEAEQAWREALSINLAAHGDGTETAIDRLGVGTAVFAQGRHDEGIAEVRACVATLRRTVGAHPRVVNALNRLASMLARTGHRDEAETLLRESLELGISTVGGAHFLTNEARRELGAVLIDAAPEQAIALLTEARRILQSDPARRRKRLEGATLDLARALAVAHRFDAAESLLLEHIESADDPARARALAQLAELYLAWGRPADAARVRGEGQAVTRGSRGSRGP